MPEKTVGRYIVRVAREGNAFVYDIFRSGLLVAVGFDLLSSTADEVFAGIQSKYGGQT
jgi:hypothetical protein